MTDIMEIETLSTEGTYSPPIQKALSLGNKEYALKNYEKAVEHYGEASELQYVSLLSNSCLELKTLVKMTLISSFYMGKHYFKSRRRIVKSSEALLLATQRLV
jgi:hypothetical protein